MEVDWCVKGLVGVHQTEVAVSRSVVDPLVGFAGGEDGLVAVGDEGDFGALAAVVCAAAAKPGMEDAFLAGDSALVAEVGGCDEVVVDGVADVASPANISPAAAVVGGAVLRGEDLEVKRIGVSVPPGIQ